MWTLNTGNKNKMKIISMSLKEQKKRLENTLYGLKQQSDTEENEELQTKILQQIEMIETELNTVIKQIQNETQQKENLNCIIQQLQEKNMITNFNEETINMAYEILEIIFTKHLNIKIEITSLTEEQKEEIKIVLRTLKQTQTIQQ